MSVEQDVASHYTRAGLERVLLDALAASGKDIERLDAADLSGADEFHLGWHPATVELAQAIELPPGARLLDIGCGIGGPARHFANMHGWLVTGIDLTPDFVDVATSLTRRCGLSERATFRQASALALPFEGGSFEGATMIHVGMNIDDKAGVFAEARRVLGRGARFAVYDVMRTSGEAIPYPMPWAETEKTSFVDTPDTYRRLLTESGFEIESTLDRREMVLRLGREMREKAERDGAPPIGLHLLMGSGGPERIANVMATLARGTIAPVQIVARAV